MPSRVEAVRELKNLFKQAFIPVPPYESAGPQGPPQGDPAAQAPPAGPPPQGMPPEQGGAPPQGMPPEQGGSPAPAPGAVPLPPEVAAIMDKVVSSQQEVNQRVQALEAKFEQDKLLRDKDREHAEKRRQLIETVLPAASV